MQYDCFALVLFWFLVCRFKVSSCLERDICQEKGLCHHINRSVNYKINSCFCEEDNCWIYDDCCRDVKLPPNSIKKVETSCERIPNTNEKIYVANSCPPTWTDDNVRLLCRKNVSEKYYSHVLDLPYLSNVTNILYSNVYCAKCNDDALYPSELQANLLCTNYNPCDRSAILNATYYPGDLWWRPNTNSIASVKMKIITLKLRKCRAVIVAKCASNWTDVNIGEKCKSHANYVESDRITIYRNIYCAQCNYVDVSKLKCISTLKLMVFTFRTYGSLIDFGIHDVVCPSVNEIYDPLTETCQESFCGKSYMKVEGQCVLRENLNNGSMKSCSALTANVEDLLFYLNGTVFHKKTSKTYNPNEYESHNSTTYLICGDEDAQFRYVRAFSQFSSILTVVCIIISAICLLIHIIIRCITEDVTRIAEKNLLNLSLSLLIAQLAFLLGIIADISENFCYTIGIITHFFFLVVFFWMSVISFDVYRTLSKCEQMSMRKCTFHLYFCFAWFVPMIIVLIAIMADQTDLMPSLQPNYARNGLCWISRKFALFIFFALPLAIILIVNTVFYVLTAYNIRKTVKVTRIVKKSLDHSLFCVYVRLAVVVGITWIIGFAANFIDVEPLWYAFIILNASQGTFLFVAFTLKRRVLSRLRGKLGRNRRKSSKRIQVYTKISSCDKSSENRTSCEESKMNNNPIKRTM